MNKTVEPDITDLLKEVQALLDAKCKRRKFRLRVPKGGYTIHDEWITIVADPTRDNVRAYDYVEVLAEVEGELRARGHKHVLLVPALTD